jgi:microcystin-dependent protein
MGMNWLVRIAGDEERLGDLMLFGGDTPPAGWTYANGALLPVHLNRALYSRIGTDYGGEAEVVFALPDLSGRTPIGRGQGAGLSDHFLSEQSGSETVVLNSSNLPSHRHETPDGFTGFTGQSVPYQNSQPTLALSPRIALQGVSPSAGGGQNVGTSPLIGQIRISASAQVPSGWTEMHGQLLPINGNAALHAVLDENYGGDGRTNFALPDMRGRGAVHVGEGPGLSEQFLGQMSGEEMASMLFSHLPRHRHLYSDPEDGPPFIFTDDTGHVQPQPQDNMQPTLALNYIIALGGVMPVASGAVNEAGPYVGEISLFAGDFAPAGWALANGQMLERSLYGPLFSVIGNTYGGDGITEFALPDLRGRLPVGIGEGTGPNFWERGEKAGSETVTFDVGQMATHTHSVPEPGMISILIGASLVCLRRVRFANRGSQSEPYENHFAD